MAGSPPNNKHYYAGYEAGRKMQEETELDEVSQATKNRYTRAASKDLAKRSMKHGQDMENDAYWNAAHRGETGRSKNADKMRNRMKGIKRATKEETELDETRRNLVRKDDGETGEEHIIMQHKKARDFFRGNTGSFELKFQDGSKKKITSDHARQVMKVHDAMKPAHKEKFTAALSKSASSYTNTLKRVDQALKNPKALIKKAAEREKEQRTATVPFTRATSKKTGMTKQKKVKPTPGGYRGKHFSTYGKWDYVDDK